MPGGGHELVDRLRQALLGSRDGYDGAGAGAGRLSCGSGAGYGGGSTRLAMRSGGEGHCQSGLMVEGIGSAAGTLSMRLAARSWDVVRDDTRSGDAVLGSELAAQVGVLRMVLRDASSSFLFLCSSCPCKYLNLWLRSARLWSLPCRLLGAGEWFVKMVTSANAAPARFVVACFARTIAAELLTALCSRLFNHRARSSAASEGVRKPVCRSRLAPFWISSAPKPALEAYTPSSKLVGEHALSGPTSCAAGHSPLASTGRSAAAVDPQVMSNGTPARGREGDGKSYGAVDVSLSATAQSARREWLGPGSGGGGERGGATSSVSSSRRAHAVRPRAPNSDKHRVPCTVAWLGRSSTI